MARKRKISVREISRDIRAGASESALAAKYHVYRDSLRKAFKALEERHAITHAEYCKVSGMCETVMGSLAPRAHSRAEVLIYVPVPEPESQEIGVLENISEGGFCVVGIEAEIGDVRSFVIPVNRFTDSGPMIVEAECKWIKPRGGDKLFTEAGFEIKDLLEEDKAVLREFTERLKLGRSETLPKTSPAE